MKAGEEFFRSVRVPPGVVFVVCRVAVFFGEGVQLIG